MGSNLLKIKLLTNYSLIYLSIYYKMNGSISEFDILDFYNSAVRMFQTSSARVSDLIAVFMKLLKTTTKSETRVEPCY